MLSKFISYIAVTVHWFFNLLYFTGYMFRFYILIVIRLQSRLIRIDLQDILLLRTTFYDNSSIKVVNKFINTPLSLKNKNLLDLNIYAQNYSTPKSQICAESSISTMLVSA